MGTFIVLTKAAPFPSPPLLIQVAPQEAALNYQAFRDPLLFNKLKRLLPG